MGTPEYYANSDGSAVLNETFSGAGTGNSGTLEMKIAGSASKDIVGYYNVGSPTLNVLWSRLC